MSSASTQQMKILLLGLKYPKEREQLKTLVPSTFKWESKSFASVWSMVKSMGAEDSLGNDLVEDYCDRNDLNLSTFMATLHEVLDESIAAPSFFLSVVEEEIEKQRILSLLDDAVALVKSNEIGEAAEALTAFQKSQTSKARSIPVVDFWSGWSKRLERRAKEETEGGPRVGFGVDPIDEALNGGLGQNQLGIVVGHTGRGKSVMAQNLAIRAASKKRLTLYVPTEMSYDQVSDRMDSRILSLPISTISGAKLDEETMELVDAKRLRLAEMYSDNLKVWAVPPLSVSAADLERTLDRVEQESGRKVEVLVIDSPDHLMPNPRYEYRLQMAEIYWQMKEIAEGRSICVWTTTQAPKEYKYKLLTAEAVADSYDKARIADCIVTLNQTVVEEGAGVLRLHIAKNRNGQAGVIAPLKLDYGSMRYRLAREDELV